MAEDKTTVNEVDNNVDISSFVGSLLPNPASHKAVWDGITVEHQRQPPGEGLLHVPQHVITLTLGRPYRTEWHWETEHRWSGRANHGDIAITPSGLQARGWWEDQAEFLVVSLEPELIAQAALESFNTDRIEIISQKGARDPLIQQIGLALKAEVDSVGLTGRLYAESLGNALAFHLLRHYSSFGKTPQVFTGSLPKHKLQRAIEYINDNLASDLTLAEIAKAVDMNPYHFARTFKKATGLSPHQYVIQCRIEQAKNLLANKELSIAEIALRVGFSNQSHFTVFFRKLTSTTPKVYREAL